MSRLLPYFFSSSSIRETIFFFLFFLLLLLLLLSSLFFFFFMLLLTACLLPIIVMFSNSAKEMCNNNFTHLTSLLYTASQIFVLEILRKALNELFQQFFMRNLRSRFGLQCRIEVLHHGSSEVTARCSGMPLGKFDPARSKFLWHIRFHILVDSLNFCGCCGCFHSNSNHFR